MELLSDPSTLDVEFLDTDTVWVGDTPVEVAQIAFTSYQSTDCEIGTIRLEGSLAAIRAITLLEDWVGVDDSRLGVWGHSGSDIGAGLAAGVDSRISLAVIEPSFPDLGESQERFEETLIMDAAVPTFVLGCDA
ncbi:MAG TPA: hypothetical protein QGF58_03655 [Myxococcota bacterium]|nr:hypothetical protein [Myxococcota bacterium]